MQGKAFLGRLIYCIHSIIATTLKLIKHEFGHIFVLFKFTWDAIVHLWRILAGLFLFVSMLRSMSTSSLLFIATKVKEVFNLELVSLNPLKNVVFI